MKEINLFAFGKGNVGGRLLEQIFDTDEQTTQRRKVKVNVVGIADSQRMIFDKKGINRNWRDVLLDSSQKNEIDYIIQLLQEAQLDNVVIADNTASESLTENYPNFIHQGFNIVASNKRANAHSWDFYQNIRHSLQEKKRLFYYETNVGAGLPLIDTLRHLHDSGDDVVRVRGVFSGSLSYIFNHFSVNEIPFSSVLQAAKAEGLTEPDPREDLSGLDVARKLIILAREIGMKVELGEVQIDSLIPKTLADEPNFTSFLEKKHYLDMHFSQLKSELKDTEVLRYVGELDVLQNQLKVSLIKVDKFSPLGNVKNADAIFEIYTSSYGEQPIVIQGAGAGSEVTARGVYTDLLRIGKQC